MFESNLCETALIALETKKLLQKNTIKHFIFISWMNGLMNKHYACHKKAGWYTGANDFDKKHIIYYLEKARC